MVSKARGVADPLDEAHQGVGSDAVDDALGAHLQRGRVPLDQRLQLELHVIHVRDLQHPSKRQIHPVPIKNLLNPFHLEYLRGEFCEWISSVFYFKF